MSTDKPETPEKPPKKTPQRITIDIPKELEAVYANVAFISHTAAEIVMDMAQVLPRSTKGKLVARVIMSPMHAKLFHRALGQNIANFERQFGEIRLPRSLADELFNFPPPSATDEE